MNIFNNKKIFPVKFNKKNNIYFYIPYFLTLMWISFSIISIFFIGFKNITDGFVIFSIFIRIIIAVLGILFFNKIFLQRNKEKKTYNVFKAFVGYGVVFTYVFYSLPRMVGEFHGNIETNFAVFSFIIVLFITAFPLILYIFLRLNKTRLVFEVYSKKEIDYENKIKKDKALRKKEHHKIKSERSFLANLWYEWIDVIIQAIIIALLIQQFLFQMYQIPSESMVPTFIKKDRVVVNKMLFGPHIPLTEWKLPSPIKPKVGDIVVFKNPKMEEPGSDVRYKNVFTRIFHPFIFMLTLSMVDIDQKPKDPFNPNRIRAKERFIVKRLVAQGGEKICMVNDKVYKRNRNSDWKLMENIAGQREYGQADLY